MPAAAFELRDQLGEIVIDSPPLNLFSKELIARSAYCRRTGSGE